MATDEFIQYLKAQKAKTESPIEAVMLREFHLLDLYPSTQYVVGRYRLDLAFPKEMVAIECDGKEWHSSPEQVERDRLKDEFLTDNGWRVIRISGGDIFRRSAEIAKIITGRGEARKKKIRRQYLPIDYENMDYEQIQELEDKNRTIAEGYEDVDGTSRDWTKAKDVLLERTKDLWDSPPSK